VEDHVHLFSTLSRTCEPAKMVKEVKRGSSFWLKTKGSDLRDFAWQNGYGMFSIGFSQIEGVRSYIAGQEEHHRKVSFQDEFRHFYGDTKSNSMNGMFGIDATPLELLILATEYPA
jgi:putative transposase